MSFISRIFGGGSGNDGGAISSSHPVVRDTLKQLGTESEVSKSLKDKIHATWKVAYKNDSEAFFGAVYDVLKQMLEKLVESKGEDQETGALVLKYLQICAATDYTGYNVSHLESLFANQSPMLVRYIEELLAQDNHDYPVPDGPRRRSDSGEIIERLFHLYFYHLTYPKLERRADVMALIRPYYLKYNDRVSNLVISLLAHDSSGVPEMAALVSHAITHPSEENAGAYLLGEMLSRFAKREDFEHKHAVKILKLVFAEERAWSDEQVAWLVHHLFLAPLDIEEDKTAEGELEKMTAALKWAKKYPDTKAEYEAKIARIESGFDGYLSDRLAEAATFVRKSKVRQRCAKLVLERFAGSKSLRPLSRLLEAVESGVSGNRTYVLDQTPSVEFADDAFKLMVIEELMYRRKVLKPKFDVHKFAKEYEARDISIEDDGYAVIPEAMEYLMRLEIPQEMLNSVTELTLDDGCGGGMETTTQVYPFWDPGCGDEVMAPSLEMLNDLPHLPNLERIIFIGTEPPEIRAQLEEAGITVIFEDYG